MHLSSMGKWGKVEDFGVFNENHIDYLNHNL